jgi:hypothetical protein
MFVYEMKAAFFKKTEFNSRKISEQRRRELPIVII